jgi:hypothetical protein
VVRYVHMSYDIATAVYYTGIDPFTKQEVYVAKAIRDRKMQRALMQFFRGPGKNEVSYRNRKQMSAEPRATNAL